MIWRKQYVIALALVLSAAGSALALTPDQIALVVNKNAPESIQLAQIYSQARGIPNDRTIVLDIPPGDEVTFDDYEQKVVPPIRAFLRDRNLEARITCLVTFYGVPFRIRARSPSDADKSELADIEDQFKGVSDQLDALIGQEEKLARTLDPDFHPAPRIFREPVADWLARRHSAAANTASASVNAIADPLVRRKYEQQVLNLLIQVGGAAELMRRVGVHGITDMSEPDSVRQNWINLQDQVEVAHVAVLDLEQRRYDADARAELRRIMAKTFGPIMLLQTLESQIDYLKPGTTNAAFDNELALLWWYGYPRQDWWFNPLNYRLRGELSQRRTLMVSRLDGPDVPTVVLMIHTSVAVEEAGLHGCLALNSYNYPHSHMPNNYDAYRQFDQKIRDLGKMARDKTTVDVHEQYTHFFQHQEMKQTALYCGWYSLRHFIDGMDFVPGAVGYHVASLEMVGLHGKDETGWVHGLLSHGVVATLGAVAEPYLTAFPDPREFFPLLMTGKLTLAEVYWKTEPAASWMICLVGDPLYNPYKNDPAMKVEDLSPELQTAVAQSTTADSVKSVTSP